MGNQTTEVRYSSHEPTVPTLDLPFRLTSLLTSGLDNPVQTQPLGLKFQYPLPSVEIHERAMRAAPALQGTPRNISVPADTPDFDAHNVGILSLDDIIRGLGTDVRVLLRKVPRFSTRAKAVVAVTALPSAADVYELLLQRRLLLFELYQKEDELEAAVRLNQYLATAQRLAGMAGQFESKRTVRTFVACTIAINALLIHTAVRHILAPVSEVGFIYGLAREIVILEQLNPKRRWSSAAKAFVEMAITLAMAVSPTMAPLALGKASLGRGSHESRDRDSSTWIPYDDWTRLLFYMKVPGYRGIRGGPAFGRGGQVEIDVYEYLAVVLQRKEKQNAVVLDTVEVGHAALLLHGQDLNQLLALCQQDRSLIQKSPLFMRRFVHHGEWEPRLRRILDDLLTRDC